MFDLTAMTHSPMQLEYERLQDLEQWVPKLDANLKILAMPYKGETAWGVHITDKKGRYDITGQGKTLGQAVNAVWPEFLNVQKMFVQIP
jgi:hypothetical protein